MGYELWLSLRYLLARRRERFVSIIAVLSIGGVALGVMALLVVLSVMSGFDHDLKEKLLGTNAHLTIEADGGIKDLEPVLRKLSGLEHVEGVSPFISGQAIVRLPERAFGVLVRGLDAEREARVTSLQDYLVAGKLPRAENEVVIGTELGASIAAGPGDSMTLISPANGKAHEMVISGVFHSGMYEYDASLIGVSLLKAQQLFDLPDTVGGLSLRLDELERAGEMKRRIATLLGPRYIVRTWIEMNQTLFDALKLEKVVMFIILTLIVLVAAVNIISTLIMMVTEKTKDIGILKAVGASSGSVRSIFVWQGLIIGILGTTLGVLGALGLIWLQTNYQIVQLPNTIYYLDHLPMRIELIDWAPTIVAAVLISLLATVYPAGQAAHLSPVEALRYE